MIIVATNKRSVEINKQSFGDKTFLSSNNLWLLLSVDFFRLSVNHQLRKFTTDTNQLLAKLLRLVDSCL